MRPAITHCGKMFVALALVLSMSVSATAAIGMFVDEYGAPLNFLTIPIDQPISLDFAIIPDTTMVLEAYFIDFSPTLLMSDLQLQSWNDTSLLSGGLIPGTGFVDSMFFGGVTQPLTAGVPTVLGQLTFTDFTPGDSLLTWDPMGSGLLGDLAFEPIFDVLPLMLYTDWGGPQVPDLTPAVSLFAPRFEPYTATVMANDTIDTKLDFSAFACGTRSGPMSTGLVAYATAELRAIYEPTFSTVAINLQGYGGEDFMVFYDPETGEPMPESWLIPGDASADFDGVIAFDLLDPDPAMQGMPLDLLVEATVVGFDGYYVDWDCQIFDGPDLLAEMDPSNTTASIEVLAGQPGLRVVVHADDSAWGPQEQFDSQLYLTFTGVPEPGTMALLTLGLVTLARRRRR